MWGTPFAVLFGYPHGYHIDYGHIIGHGESAIRNGQLGKVPESVVLITRGQIAVLVRKRFPYLAPSSRLQQWAW